MRQLGVSGSPEKEVPAAAAAAAAVAAAAAPEKEKKRVRSYDVESTTDCSDQEEEGVDDKGYAEEMEYGTADEQQEPNVWESESVKEKKEEEDDDDGVWHEAERRYQAQQAKEDEDMEERVVSPPHLPQRL